MDKLPKNKQLFSSICWKINFVTVISPMCQNQHFSRCVTCNMTCQIDWNGTVLGSKDLWVGKYENLRIRSMDLYISMFMHWHVSSDLHMYFFIHGSTDPQILVSLHPWVHRSLDLHIFTCLNPHISLFMHWQALISANPQMSVSLHPWIHRFQCLYIHRSAYTQIFLQISGSSYLYINWSVDPDIHISASTDPSTPT